MSVGSVWHLTSLQVVQIDAVQSGLFSLSLCLRLGLRLLELSLQPSVWRKSFDLSLQAKRVSIYHLKQRWVYAENLWLSILKTPFFSRKKKGVRQMSNCCWTSCQDIKRKWKTRIIWKSTSLCHSLPLLPSNCQLFSEIFIRMRSCHRSIYITDFKFNWHSISQYCRYSMYRYFYLFYCNLFIKKNILYQEFCFSSPAVASVGKYLGLKQMLHSYPFVKVECSNCSLRIWIQRWLNNEGSCISLCHEQFVSRFSLLGSLGISLLP